MEAIYSIQKYIVQFQVKLKKGKEKKGKNTTFPLMNNLRKYVNEQDHKVSQYSICKQEVQVVNIDR